MANRISPRADSAQLEDLTRALVSGMGVVAGAALGVWAGANTNYNAYFGDLKNASNAMIYTVDALSGATYGMGIALLIHETIDKIIFK